MAKKKKNHAARKEKVPLFATAGAVLTAYGMYSNVKSAGGGHLPNTKAEVDSAVFKITGYDVNAGAWSEPMRALSTVAPAGLGILGSKLASKLKANSLIKAIPYIKW